jgi:hypothetical protein
MYLTRSRSASTDNANRLMPTDCLTDKLPWHSYHSLSRSYSQMHLPSPAGDSKRPCSIRWKLASPRTSQRPTPLGSCHLSHAHRRRQASRASLSHATERRLQLRRKDTYLRTAAETQHTHTSLPGLLDANTNAICTACGCRMRARRCFLP